MHGWLAHSLIVVWFIPHLFSMDVLPHHSLGCASNQNYTMIFWLLEKKHKYTRSRRKKKTFQSSESKTKTNVERNRKKVDMKNLNYAKCAWCAHRQHRWVLSIYVFFFLCIAIKFINNNLIVWDGSILSSAAILARPHDWNWRYFIAKAIIFDCYWTLFHFYAAVC